MEGTTLRPPLVGQEEGWFAMFCDGIDASFIYLRGQKLSGPLLCTEGHVLLNNMMRR